LTTDTAQFTGVRFGPGALRTVAANSWLKFITRRILRLVVSLAVVMTASFAMIHLIPGDPVRAALGQSAPPRLVASRRHLLGLDRPLVHQYLSYVNGLLHGHLGTSIVTDDSVGNLIATRLPNTLALAGFAFLLVLLAAYPVGLLAAIGTHASRRPRTELAFTSVTGFLATVPEFVLAAALVAVFAVTYRIFPVAGKSGAISYVLPVISLAVGPAAVLSRIVRVEALRVLGEEYIRTARGKRLPARIVYLRHAFPNMLTGSLTIAGSLLPALISGTVLVENVFGWPGLGTAISDSVVQQDYAVVQAVVLVLGGSVLLINFLVDCALAVLDPLSTIRET
jgi:peptide/nickel transport system permease protein